MKNFTKSILVLFITISANYAFALPKLNSLTSATATIFLDFDGQTVSSAYWNAGNKLFCIAPSLTDAQITEIFQRVSEDYPCLYTPYHPGRRCRVPTSPSQLPSTPIRRNASETRRCGGSRHTSRAQACAKKTSKVNLKQLIGYCTRKKTSERSHGGHSTKMYSR